MAKKRKSFKQDTDNKKQSCCNMDGTDKPLTRDALVGMQVIDAKGRAVGKVKDVAFAIGKAGIALSIESENGELKNIPWEDVQAASDYIILKPSAVQTQQQPAQATQQQSQPLCPTCSKPLTWIPQYQRWYCYNEKKYV